MDVLAIYHSFGVTENAPCAGERLGPSRFCFSTPERLHSLDVRAASFCKVSGT